MEPVTSPRNPRVAAAARLHRARERKATGLTLIEGPHLLAEAQAGGADIREVFAVADDERATLVGAGGPSVTPVTELVLSRIAGTEHPRGPVAVIAIPPPVAARSDIVLLAVNDPGNAGSLIRTAAAFGYEVAVFPGAVDVWSPKVLRGAAGGHFRTRIVNVPEADERAVVTLAVSGGVTLDRAASLLDPEPLVTLVVGNEAHGVPESLRLGARLEITIPMEPGVESLNAAVAGALAMYELRKRRTDRPTP